MRLTPFEITAAEWHTISKEVDRGECMAVFGLGQHIVESVEVKPITPDFPDSPYELVANDGAAYRIKANRRIEVWWNDHVSIYGDWKHRAVLAERRVKYLAKLYFALGKLTQ